MCKYPLKVELIKRKQMNNQWWKIVSVISIILERIYKTTVKFKWQILRKKVNSTWTDVYGLYSFIKSFIKSLNPDKRDAVCPICIFWFSWNIFIDFSNLSFSCWRYFSHISMYALKSSVPLASSPFARFFLRDSLPRTSLQPRVTSALVKGLSSFSEHLRHFPPFPLPRKKWVVEYCRHRMHLIWKKNFQFPSQWRDLRCHGSP